MKEGEEKQVLKFLNPIGGFHGVSAIFPKFQDIIDYEENKFSVYQGYPRFVPHPVIKELENQWKERFNALEAISSHSFNLSIFLLIDYFFEKGNKIYLENGLPSKLISLLDKKFPNIVSKTISKSDANILVFNDLSNNIGSFLKEKTVISLLNNPITDKDYSYEGDFIICHDYLNDIGVILNFNPLIKDLNIIRRHCGFNVSSRKVCGNYETLHLEKEKMKTQLKKRITNLEKIKTKHCYFYPSGMAAIFSSIFSLLTKKRPKFIGLGSLYVDTLKILEKWPEKYGLSRTNFIRDSIVKNLRNHIDNQTAGVIVEVPSNPLIRLVDIEKVIDLVHQKGAKIIVDSTIATPFNFNPFNYNADLVVHSSTKFLNGRNDHIGGILITKNNELGEKIDKFNKLLKIDMSFNDIRTLSKNLAGFEKRMEKINKNTEIVANFLNDHRFIKKVYFTFPDCMTEKYLKGGSGLLSFILRNSSIEIARQFYNNILPPILKGPSLGSEKSLLSPYVLMAHYNASETELERLGLDRYLMRLSVGTESVEDIIQSLKHALNSVG